MTRQSAVVVISYTGRSKELIENVRIARECGAVVIGITSPHSPLAEECSQIIAVELDEDTDIYTPMSSRLSHLLVLDILVVGVSLQLGEQLADRLMRMKQALSTRKSDETG
jgi:RpiR family carbohydrate utilization transcriptional regulator